MPLLSRRLVIEEGYADDASVEVLPREAGALTAGTRVITVGGRDLEDGDAVQDEGEEPEAAPAEEASSPEQPEEPAE